MKYRIFKHTFELSDLDRGTNRMTIPLNGRRLVRWLDAKPNPTSAHKIDVWFVVDDAPTYPTPDPVLQVEGTGWLFRPTSRMSYITTVRTAADYVWHLFGIEPGLGFEESFR